MDDLNVNRKHKDSVFSALFSTPKILRELYSAIEGIDVPQDAIVDINTLSDVLYMKQINDLSFTINDRLVILVEHQSTLNDNVPVRLLMYIGRVYEKIIDRDKLYHRKLELIPTPEFIVLYNGKKQCPDYQELRLSNAFKDTTGLKLSGNNALSLELVVKVYNINQGHNSEILKRSKNLNDYSVLMNKIKEYNENLTLEKAVKNAVKYCREHNVLKEFLRRHGSEVANMLFEYITIEELAAIHYNEGREDGETKGILRVAKNMKSEGLDIETISRMTQFSPEEILKL